MAKRTDAKEKPEADKKVKGKSTKKAGKKSTQGSEKEGKESKRRPSVGPKGPLLQVKELFGSRENLIAEVKKLFEKTDIFVDKLGDGGLALVSNRKLLRLHRLAKEVSEKFGTRKGLVEEIARLTGKAEVKEVKEKLSSMTIGRLLDLYRQASRNAAKAPP